MTIPLAVVLALASLALIPGADAQEPVQIDRLQGPTRLGTAVAISQRAFPESAPVAYLARDDNPADATTAGSLTDGPILLVPTCGELPGVVREELTRLAPSGIIGLGGPNAICDDMLRQAADAADGVVADDAPTADAMEVAATVRLVTDDGQPVDPDTVPFNVAVTDPGLVEEGATVAHQLQITATDDLTLQNPRFAGVTITDDGQLVITDDRSDPMYRNGEASVVYEDSFTEVDLAAGDSSELDLTLHTKDDEVGPTPLAPGTYRVQSMISWTNGDASDPSSIWVEVQYDVSQA